jgi:uncharacterized RDD family membrane protein YckC
MPKSKTSHPGIKPGPSIWKIAILTTKLLNPSFFTLICIAQSGSVTKLINYSMFCINFVTYKVYYS